MICDLNPIASKSRPGGTAQNRRTRILFVDDEASILELLEMTLASMNDLWEGAFAQSGEQALCLFAEGPFDIVVSDMRMPSMSGAQLLNEIMKRQPATTRIILSGYANEESTLQCAGSAHQFLTKPFKLAALVATLNHIRTVRERLPSAEIRTLVAQTDHLPSIPAIYFKILELLEKPDCPLQLIAEVVATDPGLTTKLLQMVNSAFFGFAREVSSPEEAVMLLGIGPIRSLALSAHLFSAFETKRPEDACLASLWNHSTQTALLARRIALLELQAADQCLAEQAFTAGLLHDVGMLVLAKHPQIDYVGLVKQAREQGRHLIQAEREAFGVSHAEVGAYLLDLWGLPAALVEAVALHHEPSRTRCHSFSPLTAVHVANALLADQKMFLQEGLPAGLELAYLQRLDLEHRVGLWRNELRDMNGEATEVLSRRKVGCHPKG